LDNRKFPTNLYNYFVKDKYQYILPGLQGDLMDTSQSKSTTISLSLFTWAIVLLVSDLPNAIWQALWGEPPAWLFGAKVVLLLIIILVSLVWKPIQVVRPYLILLLVLMLALWGMNWVMGTNAYNQWQKQAGWLAAMAGFQLLKLVVTSVMIIVLLLMGRQRKEFFLTTGELSAPIKSVKAEKNPGKPSMSWKTLGLILGFCIAPLTLLFFGLGNLPSADTLVEALPLFPVALLFAATNAFSEETHYRASMLGDAQRIVGADQAIWLTATFFGFAHYFGGAPAGVPGVLIAGLLGALFARCMLGSKGIAVPWFIHFCQNAVIFAFWAIGTVA
jgi:membrane protease YdiL (CAAX protease family)